MWLEIVVAKLATNFQDLVAKVKNLVALAPVLGAILRPAEHLFPSYYFRLAVLLWLGFDLPPCVAGFQSLEVQASIRIVNELPPLNGNSSSLISAKLTRAGKIQESRETQRTYHESSLASRVHWVTREIRDYSQSKLHLNQLFLHFVVLKMRSELLEV